MSNENYLLNNAIGNDLGNARIYTNHVKNKRYYSSVDAKIMINSVELEEVVQIQWSEEENMQPLFGYNSYIFDEMAVGSRLITGQFAINFIIPDYLNYVINKEVTGSDENITYKNSGAEKKNDEHKPKHAKSFDISIAYGSRTDAITGKQPYIILKDCYVKTNGQALDTRGGGIVEVYSFIAKDKYCIR